MADLKTKVHLLGQAKVGDRWIPAGDQDVTAEELEALKAEGLIDGEWLTGAIVVGDFSDQRTFTAAEWHAAVEAAALKIAGQAFDGELGRLEAEVKAIMAQTHTEIAAANARTAEAEKALADHIEQAAADVSRIQQRNAELEATIAALTPPAAERQSGTASADQDTPPSEKAAKTAPKKGAAATTKG